MSTPNGFQLLQESKTTNIHIRKSASDVVGVKKPFTSKADLTCTEIYTEENRHMNVLLIIVKNAINGLGI